MRGLAATRQGADVVLTWGTQSGVSYKIQTSADLGSWSDAPSITVVLNAETQTATATDVGAGGGWDRFYRVVCALDAP